MPDASRRRVYLCRNCGYSITEHPGPWYCPRCDSALLYRGSPTSVRAVYRCRSCGHKFSNHPGPWDCPKCGCLWLEWLNYGSIDWLRDQHGAAHNEVNRG